MLHFYVFYGKNKVNTNLYSHLQEEEKPMLVSIEEVPVLIRPTVQEVFEQQNLTVNDAVAATGLTFDTVHRAVYGDSSHRISEGTANAIARFLGVSVDSVTWPQPLTHVGRPALSRARRREHEDLDIELCPVCFLQLSTNGTCPSCDTP